MKTEAQGPSNLVPCALIQNASECFRTHAAFKMHVSACACGLAFWFNALRLRSAEQMPLANASKCNFRRKRMRR